MSKILLDLDDDDTPSFNINENYAEKYENWRRLEEMQKMKDKYGDGFDEEEEGTSSSESEPEWTANDEKDFLRTLGALKSQTEEIYDTNTKFFKNKETSETSTSQNKEKRRKDKQMFLKDYERKVVLEKRGKIEEDDENKIDDKKESAGYYEEQEEIKRELKKALRSSDSDSEDDFLVKREKTHEDKKLEEEDYYEWLKDQKDLDTIDTKELKSLKKVWNDPLLDKDEQFLRDYLLNKDYEPGKSDTIPTYDEICKIEKEDEEFEKQIEYEHKYNFRFEEPDQDFIKQYPRTVSESIRKPNEKRKEKREAYRERKDREKEEKAKEINEMRRMKKAEINTKLEKLKKLAGEEIAINVDDLEGDFDPKEYDRRMKELFDNDYYGKELDEGDEKPVFSDMSDISSGESNYDDMEIGTVKLKKKTKSNSVKKDNGEINGDDQDEELEKFRGKNNATGRRKKRNSKFAEAVAREKPLFDPKEKTFEEYFNEYYALDYEDILGDQTTRFKYRSVIPNSFGLSPEEILAADDRQLNAWASLKKAVGYRTDAEERFDVMAYGRKASDVEKKKRIFDKDFGGKKSKKMREQELSENHEECIQNTDDGKKKKKKNKKKKTKQIEGKESTHQEPTDTVVEPLAETALPSLTKKKTAKKVKENTKNDGITQTEENEKKKGRTRKRKARPNVNAPSNAIDIADERLKAYGINPKKFKKNLKFSTKKSGEVVE